jgi:hypothetical protein
MARSGMTVGRRAVGRLLFSGLLCVIGCGKSGHSVPPDASDGAGASVDCAAVCGRVRDLCAGRPDVDDVWVDACQTQCGARVQLQPATAAEEAACVGAASTCDTAVTCAADPGATPPSDGAADHATGGPDSGGGKDAAAVVDARTSTDTGVAPSMVRATVDGTPVVFDHVTNVQLISDVILIQASTSDQTRAITTYTASGTGILPTLPATYGCTSSDIGYLHYTVYGAGGPDAGPGQTYGDTSSGSSPCKVTYTRVDFTRIQGTFFATAFGSNGSVTITNGVIDVAVR